MTREEAIFYIKELQKTSASTDKKVAEAVNMAIEALQREDNLLKSMDTNEPLYTEVVRCKDCKHWYADADTGMACEFTNMGQPEDGYCNWGERKGGDDE